MNFKVQLLLRQLANTGKTTQINTVKASNGYGATQNQFRMRFHYSFFIIHLMHLRAAAKRDTPALPPYTRQEFLPLPLHQADGQAAMWQVRAACSLGNIASW